MARTVKGSRSRASACTSGYPWCMDHGQRTIWSDAGSASALSVSDAGSSADDGLDDDERARDAGGIVGIAGGAASAADKNLHRAASSGRVLPVGSAASSATSATTGVSAASSAADSASVGSGGGGSSAAGVRPVDYGPGAASVASTASRRSTTSSHADIGTGSGSGAGTGTGAGVADPLSDAGTGHRGESGRPPLPVPLPPPRRGEASLASRDSEQLQADAEADAFTAAATAIAEARASAAGLSLGVPSSGPTGVLTPSLDALRRLRRAEQAQDARDEAARAAAAQSRAATATAAARATEESVTFPSRVISGDLVRTHPQGVPTGAGTGPSPAHTHDFRGAGGSTLAAGDDSFGYTAGAIFGDVNTSGVSVGRGAAFGVSGGGGGEFVGAASSAAAFGVRSADMSAGRSGGFAGGGMYESGIGLTGSGAGHYSHSHAAMASASGAMQQYQGYTSSSSRSMHSGGVGVVTGGATSAGVGAGAGGGASNVRSALSMQWLADEVARVRGELSANIDVATAKVYDALRREQHERLDDRQSIASELRAQLTAEMDSRHATTVAAAKEESKVAVDAAAAASDRAAESLGRRLDEAEAKLSASAALTGFSEDMARLRREDRARIDELAQALEGIDRRIEDAEERLVLAAPISATPTLVQHDELDRRLRQLAQRMIDETTSSARLEEELRARAATHAEFHAQVIEGQRLADEQRALQAQEAEDRTSEVEGVAQAALEEGREAREEAAQVWERAQEAMEAQARASQASVAALEARLADSEAAWHAEVQAVRDEAASARQESDDKAAAAIEAMQGELTGKVAQLESRMASLESTLSARLEAVVRLVAESCETARDAAVQQAGEGAEELVAEAAETHNARADALEAALRETQGRAQRLVNVVAELRAGYVEEVRARHDVRRLAGAVDTLRGEVHGLRTRFTATLRMLRQAEDDREAAHSRARERARALPIADGFAAAGPDGRVLSDAAVYTHVDATAAADAASGRGSRPGSRASSPGRRSPGPAGVSAAVRAADGGPEPFAFVSGGGTGAFGVGTTARAPVSPTPPDSRASRIRNASASAEYLSSLYRGDGAGAVGGGGAAYPVRAVPLGAAGAGTRAPAVASGSSRGGSADAGSERARGPYDNLIGSLNAAATAPMAPSAYMAGTPPSRARAAARAKANLEARGDAGFGDFDAPTDAALRAAAQRYAATFDEGPTQVTVSLAGDGGGGQGAAAGASGSGSHDGGRDVGAGESRVAPLPTPTPGRSSPGPGSSGGGGGSGGAAAASAAATSETADVASAATSGGGDA